MMSKIKATRIIKRATKMSDKDFLEWKNRTNTLINLLKDDYVKTSDYLNDLAVIEMTKLQYQLLVARAHQLQCLIQTLELQIYYISDTPSVL